MPDDTTIPRPSRLGAIRRALSRDVFTGRPTVRIDVERRIDEAALPEAAKDLVRRVVGRTRLWPRERADVADELIAHFADGLAAGETADGIAQAFELPGSMSISKAVQRLGNGSMVICRDTVPLCIWLAAHHLEKRGGVLIGEMLFKRLRLFW